MVNMPATSRIVIAYALNRQWTDDNGQVFTAQVTGALDADAGVVAMNNATVMDSLRNDRPLVVGNVSHAMVLTAVDHVATPTGPYIVNVGVFDPWPGKGPRGLSEFTPVYTRGGQLRFLAAFVVR